jgi:hypothetical protein
LSISTAKDMFGQMAQQIYVGGPSVTEPAETLQTCAGQPSSLVIVPVLSTASSTWTGKVTGRLPWACGLMKMSRCPVIEVEAQLSQTNSLQAKASIPLFNRGGWHPEEGSLSRFGSRLQENEDRGGGEKGQSGRREERRQV